MFALGLEDVVNGFFVIFSFEKLAPELPSHENFVFHWKSVTNYFIESTDDKVPVQSTNIPYSLEHMLEILRLEDQDNGGSTAGPCLEYLLQHKILETLHTLGKADCPPGMKQQVLQFFTNLLGKIKTPLLPHVNVHKPVHRLIHVCGQIQAAPSENEEVQFLCTVAAKLRMYPNLVNFFLEMPYQASSNTEDVSKPRQPEKPQYSLVKSLLKLSKSEDRRIAVKACEGLMLCSSIPDDHAASVIILYTPFCEVMVDCLTGLFQSLPKEMDPAYIANIVAKWGLDRNEGGTHKFPGKRALLSFLSWLDYIDQLIREAHELIGKALSSALRERCLEAVFKPSLLEISESRVITITALLTKCLRMVNAPKTVEEYVSFFMDTSSKDDEKPEQNPEQNPCGNSPLIETLIKRCNHISDSVTIETLRLVECLLEKPVPAILDSLVLKNLVDRRYFKQNTVQNGDVSDDVTATRNEEGSDVNDLDRIELEKIVNSFLFLLPGDVKSSAELGDNGYDSYLRDAHRQCSERRNQCKAFHWPKSVTKIEVSSESPFYEGDFLNIVFKKLRNILDQPYDVNLQVTSILALISQFPHPYLHEYMLNPTLSLIPDATSLSTILREVTQDLKDRVQRLPNFKQRLLHTRKRLMSLQSIENKSEPQLNLLQGVVVLEEFCKELAAIAFVKTTNTIKER
ncbi:protein FAM160B1-like [Dendronephthya gigantea]|uniref:protein FAM160B1-like n=1 Tax=Dendronephthya gigantea TaxID=151771 RepID=UPI00106BDB21|nr:protein FAM160B1-like [Dendronephthya gigantea]